MIRRLLALACGLGAVALLVRAGSGQSNRSATVTIGISDSYGHPVKACSVKEFVSWGAGDKAGADFATRFQSLSANGIPLSLYRLVLQCADHGLFGPFWVSVDRSDESVAIGLWLHKGSYFTGGLPRLTVSTAPVSSSDNAGEQLKMLPVFVTDEKTETEPVNASGTSEFYDITPGTYVLVLVRDGRTLCANAVNVFGWQARLALTENASGCTVTPIENVTIYQH